MNKASFLTLLLALGGCSSKAVYDNVQLNKRNECSQVPPSQYDECIERAGKSYEEYQREREEVVE